MDAAPEPPAAVSVLLQCLGTAADVNSLREHLERNGDARKTWGFFLHK